MKVDPNQELLALGLSSFLGSFNFCYPPAGSLSRSAVISGIGIQTPLHNVVSTLIIIIVLLFLTTLLKSLPSAVLSAVVICAFISIFQRLGSIPALIKKNIQEGILWIICFIFTITLDTQIGIYVGLGTSFVWLIAKMMIYYKKQCEITIGRYFWNHIGSNTEYIIKESKNNIEIDLMIFKFHSNLLYINTVFNTDFIGRRVVDIVKELNEEMKLFVLDFEEVQLIDDTGINQLTSLIKLCDKLGLNIVIINVKNDVLLTLTSYDFYKVLPEEKFLRSEQDVKVYVAINKIELL